MAGNRANAKSMIDAEELDRIFDEGEEDVDQYFDVENVEYPGREARMIAIDLPASVFDALKREADRAGTAVESLAEDWIAEKVGLTVA